MQQHQYVDRSQKPCRKSHRRQSLCGSDPADAFVKNREFSRRDVRDGTSTVPIFFSFSWRKGIRRVKWMVVRFNPNNIPVNLLNLPVHRRKSHQGIHSSRPQYRPPWKPHHEPEHKGKQIKHLSERSSVRARLTIT